MNVILQAYVGALPVFIGLIVYLIKKKKYMFPAIIFAVQIIFSSFMIAVNSPTAISETDAIKVYSCYKDMASGNYSQALGAINEAFGESADRIEYTLAKARLYVLEGKWEDAVSLYEKVMDKRKEILHSEEIDFVETIVKGAMLTSEQLSYQSTNIHYLKEQGQNPAEYGFLNLTDEQIAENIKYLDNYQKNIVANIVNDQLKQMEDKYEILKEIDAIDRAVDLVMSNSYNTFTGVPIKESDKDNNSGSENSDGDNGITGGFDNELAANPDNKAVYLKQQNEILRDYKEKYPELFKEDKYLEAFIFSEILAGNMLDDVLINGGAKEYEIISNMYMSGIITENNFSSEFAEKFKEDYAEVLEKVVEIANDLAVTEDIDKVYVDGQSVSEILEDMSKEENFALQQIAQDMDALVEEDRVGSDELSEVFLTMSLVAEQTGDSEGAKDYFNEAVSHGSESSNKAVSQVMDTINEAYEEGGDDLDYIAVSEEIAKVYEDKFHYDIVSKDTTGTMKDIAGSTVSETIATVSIGNINTENFPEIKVTIQYSGDKELTKDIIKLEDCGIEIEKFTLGKKQYDGSKVILLCDVSGSMSGSIDQLKNAVKRYVKSMGNNEQVNVVLFSDKIDASTGFVSNKDQLISFADEQIYTRGGTAMAMSTVDCLGQFSNGKLANTIIVMTDGEDNRPMSDADINNQIGGLSDKNNVTVYTIGLGSSIDQNYLTKIANAGGGKFMYCSSDAVLESTYKFIHERIDSEYEITFEAEDLDSITRTLTIEINDGNMKTPVKSTKNYTLQDGATEEDDKVENGDELPEGVEIDGLDVNQINKSTERQFVNILGSGFDKVKVSNVYLESTEGQSNCKIKEVTEGKINFQIAPSVKEGTYSVFVVIDKKKYKVDTLIVGAKDEDGIIFGAYHFTADSIEITEKKTILKGNVVLNDYLFFDDTVTLEGDIYKDSSVKMLTNSPAYVHHDTSSYSKLDRIILSRRTSTKAFDGISVNIYDDEEHYNDYENYKVDAPWYCDATTIQLGVVSLEENIINVYPDRVEIKSSVGVFKDNTITDILTNSVEFFKIPSGMPYIKGDLEAKSRLMKEGPFTYFKMDGEVGVEESEIKIADFLNMEGKLAAKLMYDTYNREFEIGLGITMKDETPLSGSGTEVKNSGDAGFTVSIVGEGDNRRNSDKFLNLEVALPLEFTFYVEGVPVTLKDIKCNLDNYNITAAINDVTSGSAFSSSLKRYLTSKDGADLKVSGSIALVSTAALPDKAQNAIKKFLGDDVDLISADDIYGSVGINYPHLAAGATVNLLGCVEIAKIDMELGAISYPDYIGELLNASDGEKHYGFTFTSSKGIKFDWDRVGSNITGNMNATITVDRFLVSVYVSGVAAANASAEVFGTGFSIDGEAKIEACAAVWKDNKWNVSATAVGSVDGKSSLKVFGWNFLEHEVHESIVIFEY